jgi:hypothetical protein
MQYIPTDWKDLPSNETPISADNLNKIEGGLASLINRQGLNFSYNANWEASSPIGGQFSRVGNLVISNFSAKITTTEGNNLFLGTIPEGRRPTVFMTFPAAFVPNGQSTYQSRLLIINPNGEIQIANSPTELGTFFCTIVYFIED